MARHRKGARWGWGRELESPHRKEHKRNWRIAGCGAWCAARCATSFENGTEGEAGLFWLSRNLCASHGKTIPYSEVTIARKMKQSRKVLASPVHEKEKKRNRLRKESSTTRRYLSSSPAGFPKTGHHIWLNETRPNVHAAHRTCYSNCLL